MLNDRDKNLVKTAKSNRLFCFGNGVEVKAIKSVKFPVTIGEVNQPIGLLGRVFTNGPGDWGSIPGQVIPKTQKMVLDISLLNTQHYKVRIKDKMEQSKKRSNTLPYTSV